MADQPRILIVDDEPNIRDLLTTSLRFAGFAVRAIREPRLPIKRKELPVLAIFHAVKDAPPFR